MTSHEDRPALRLLRSGYGWTLRRLPAGPADGLRAVVARWRHRFPALEPGAGDRIAVPGRPEDPVVLIVATGLSSDRLGVLRDHLADVAARLVWLIDADEPTVLAEHVIEWLPPTDDLRRAGTDPVAIRTARLGVIEARYRPRRVVVLGDADVLPDPLLICGPPR